MTRDERGISIGLAVISSSIYHILHHKLSDDLDISKVLLQYYYLE